MFFCERSLEVYAFSFKHRLISFEKTLQSITKLAALLFKDIFINSGGGMNLSFSQLFFVEIFFCIYKSTQKVSTDSSWLPNIQFNYVFS